MIEGVMLIIPSNTQHCEFNCMLHRTPLLLCFIRPAPLLLALRPRFATLLRSMFTMLLHFMPICNPFVSIVGADINMTTNRPDKVSYFVDRRKGLTGIISNLPEIPMVRGHLVQGHLPDGQIAVVNVPIHLSPGG